MNNILTKDEKRESLIKNFLTRLEKEREIYLSNLKKEKKKFIINQASKIHNYNELLVLTKCFFENFDKNYVVIEHYKVEEIEEIIPYITLEKMYISLCSKKWILADHMEDYNYFLEEFIRDIKKIKK